MKEKEKILKRLEKCLESEKKDKTIFDIILYRSSVKGKSDFKDVDVVVIFTEGSLRQRLDKVQDIKQKLKKYSENIDIKQILVTELFSAGFFAKTGILIEGFSVFQKKKFSEVLGFRGNVLFWYNLDGLSHAQKVKFNYILAGRNDMKGMIKELGGERLVSGAVKVPVEHSAEFEEILKNNNIKYNKKEILEVV